MKSLLSRFRITWLVVFLALGVVSSSYGAVKSLPTANFSGHVVTDALGLSLSTNPAIFQVNYLDGTVNQMNNATESIIGASVSITGAIRTTDSNPSDNIYPFEDATLEVRGADDFLYISATITNIELIDLHDGFGTVAINPGLDALNPSTLNLVIHSLNTDMAHPSRYIDEWTAALAGTNIAGMSLVSILLTGDVSGSSESDIFQGILDGTPPTAEEPPGVRSMGYWKTHDDIRSSFLLAANGVDDLHGNVFVDAGDLETAVTRTGKKTMLWKAEQQLAALLLNVAQGLPESTLLSDAQKQNVLDSAVDTVGEAVQDASNVIRDQMSSKEDLERVKDLAESINTDE